MAEVIVQSGANKQAAALVPQLTGEFIPAIDKWDFANTLGVVIPWGGGRSIRESMLANTADLFAGGTQESQQLQQMSALMNSVLPQGIVNHNYYFEGLVGPQGIPGPPGPAAIGGGWIPSMSLDVVNRWGSGDISVDIPLTNGIVFTGASNKVTWTAGTLQYKGETYNITAEDTGDTNKWIYWDLNNSPTTFKTTNTIGDTLGNDKWLMCYNDTDNSTAYPAYGKPLMHAGLLQAGTITAALGQIGNLAVDTAQIANLAVETAKIDNLATETGKIDNSATRVYGVSVTPTETEYTYNAGWQAAEQVNITSDGGTVEQRFEFEITDKNGTIDVRVRANAIVHKTWTDIAVGSYTYHITTTPGSGSTFFSIDVLASTVGEWVKVANRVVRVEEDKGK
jgi:hypothetical protein